MNIGIDATCWQNQRGFGRFTRELLTALFTINTTHHFYLFIDQEPDKSMDWPHVDYIQVHPDRPLTQSAVDGDSRRVSDMAQMYKAVAKCPLDLMFFPAVYSWFPVPISLPTIVTLHDAIPEHFPKMVFPDWKSRLFWNIKVKLALWQSNRVLTVSQAAKKEISPSIGVNQSLIDVISEAPNPLFSKTDHIKQSQQFREQTNIPLNVKLIVYVGGMAPHKNLHRFLEGFSLAQKHQRMENIHVLLVGDYAGAGFHSNYNSLLQRVESDSNLNTRVHFSGFVTDEQLVIIYNDAMAVAMPSLSEGFGLPAIEAMACGTPVLSSNHGSLPEVVGEAGIYFDPYDVNAISRAIIKMSTDDDLRHQLEEIAITFARTFTWEKAAKLTMGFLESLINTKK